MHSLTAGLRFLHRQTSKIAHFSSTGANPFRGGAGFSGSIASDGVGSLSKCSYHSFAKTGSQTETLTCSSTAMLLKSPQPGLFQWTGISPPFPCRGMTTVGNTIESATQDLTTELDAPSRVKFKRLDKTAKHIMQILDKEAVQEVREQREIPDIKPGYIVQLRVEVPDNKRRVSVLKGIVIARRNAGLNSTFRLRRLVAGVGVESLFPLYSPNIKEIKILDKKKVRRAKLYYLRDKMNALKKH
ncbi:PREDICTED: 50S ribosomal protein L19, chloroplastic-like [Fragaria vesca subsp. vesca]|uniref:50S ribosomal protein L19, chloroplastic-like n=1 Tax=Fragaria vesca subsp. vesca TaxID=101020 RepID=UPI0002C2F3D9|nr:PREDICTED: 50S ribosomal protein L19, chloroplastic-like [Fragaria vesca subsp. vesca]